MIDFSLAEEQLMLQKTAREFAQNEVKPVVLEYEKNTDPSQAVIPLNSDLYKKATKLGFTKMLWPKEYGGSGLGDLELVIVLEEFAAVDVGFAAHINSFNSGPLGVFFRGANEELRKKYLEEVDAEGIVLIGGCLNEPGGGSETMCMIPDPKMGIKTYARKEGDYYVINGSKIIFSTGAGQAKYYTVLARTDLTKPQMEAASIFLIPADTPGLTIAKTTDKICWRTVPHAEIYLENVRVPKKYIIEPEGKALAFPPIFTIDLLGASIFSVGVARAAFEYAVDYAKNRVVWGQPIIKNQAIAVMLADMQIEIEAARLMVWKTAWLNDLHFRRGEFDFYHTWGSMQKVFAGEMGIRVVEKAINICGCYSLTKDLPLEKYMREALVGPITCWPNTIHRLQIANAL